MWRKTVCVMKSLQHVTGGAHEFTGNGDYFFEYFKEEDVKLFAEVTAKDFLKWYRKNVSHDNNEGMTEQVSIDCYFDDFKEFDETVTQETEEYELEVVKMERNPFPCIDDRHKGQAFVEGGKIILLCDKCGFRIEAEAEL